MTGMMMMMMTCWVADLKDAKNFKNEISQPEASSKYCLYQDVLDVIARVDPGFTKTRGLMLSEMNKVNLILAKVRRDYFGSTD